MEPHLQVCSNLLDMRVHKNGAYLRKLPFDTRVGSMRTKQWI